MEQSYPQSYTANYPTSAVAEHEQTQALTNNVAAMILFAALGVVAGVLAFIAARARRKPKTARERFMELVENGRVLGAQLAEQIGADVRDRFERIRNR